jgi:Asp-tRNA(Asn)/Glu-tRNA(Gln) amidotransferase A subunit family amidase
MTNLLDFMRPRYPDTPGYAPRDTSKEAAQRIEPETGKLRLGVLSELQVRGSTGATCDELEQALHLSHQTASARVREMSLKGTVKDSGQRRLTRSGRRAIVWQASEGWR